MTTIISFYNETTGSVLLVSDSQVSMGHLRMPIKFNKIIEICDGLLLASSGSVADSQYLGKEILKALKIRKIMSDGEDIDNISIQSFADELSEWLFTQNRSMYSRPFESSFILAGYNKSIKKCCIYSIDFDGSCILLDSFMSIGSGSELALTQLCELYERNKQYKYEDGQIANLLSRIMLGVAKMDIFTDYQLDVLCVRSDGTNTRFVETQEELKAYNHEVEVEVEQPKQSKKVKRKYKSK